CSSLFMLPPPPRPTPFPYTTLFRSRHVRKTVPCKSARTLPICRLVWRICPAGCRVARMPGLPWRHKDSSQPSTDVCAGKAQWVRSEEHTSELQSRENLVCRLLLEKK